MFGQDGVDLKEKQARVGVHPLDDFPGVAAFAGPQFHEDARLGEVALGGDPPGEDFGTGQDVSNLEWFSQESLK